MTALPEGQEAVGAKGLDLTKFMQLVLKKRSLLGFSRMGKQLDFEADAC